MARRFRRLGHIHGTPVRRLIALVFLLFMLVSLSPGTAAFPSVVDVNAEVASPGIGPVLVNDLDTDGWNDILVVDEQGNISVHFQDSLDQDFPFNDTAPVNSSVTEGMVVGLLDAYWRKDIASFTNSSLVLNFQIAAREFSKHEIPLGFAPNAIGIGDLSGDQGDDIVLVGDSELWVFFRNPSLPIFYNPSDVFQDPTGGDDVALGDFGASKALDLVISSPSELNLFIQTSQGLSYNQTIDLNGTFTISSVEVGDFNSDHLDDIVVLRSNNGTDERIEIYVQEQSGNFTFLQSIENEHLGVDFAVGDLNDDGFSDIAAVSDNGDWSVLLYIQRERTRSDFYFFFLGNLSAPGGRIALGELNGDPYTDIVLRAHDMTYIFYQDDLPPFSANQIPSRIYFNENTIGDNLIKLDDYIKDDHTALEYALILESDPDLLDAVVDGVYLDFYPKENWVGIAKFQVAGWHGDLVIHSNKFLVGVNDVPDILSAPITRGDIGKEYLYKVVVEDTYPRDDYPRFELAWGPEGMEISEFTGEITWTPEKDGDYRVAVIVTDRYGGKAEQSFVIQVGEKEEFPVALAAGGIGILALISLVGAFMAWNENAKFGFLLLFVPLYTKLKREKILDHFLRGKIYGYILANPGEHYNAIRQALGLTNGSLAHHLRTLEREHFIKSKRFGIYRRFYPMDMQMPADEFQINDIQKTIIDIVKKHPGISQKEIAAIINLTPPTVNYHIGILLHEGLVHVSRKGRKTRCFVEV